MSRKGKLDSEGWEDVEGTETGVAFSESKTEYTTSDGKHVVEAGMDFHTGKIDEVKNKLGTFVNGEQKRQLFSHKWKTQRKVTSEAGQKSFRYRCIEQDGLDGRSPETGTTAGFDPERLLDKPTEVVDDFKRWTKNIIDKILDQNLVQWAVIGLSLVLGALALGFALSGLVH